MAAGVSSKSALKSNIVISRGDVQTGRRLGESIVFANGNVSVGANLSGVVVVCEGDVTVERNVQDSLLIARGSIHAKGLTKSSNLVAGGTIKLGDRIVKPKYLATVVKENESYPFEFVEFFELTTVGVEVKLANEMVSVAKVAEGQPFAAAGVKAGDIITAVNGQKPDNAESLRRLLRDALAVGDATVTLKRGDATRTVKVSLPE